VLSPYTSQCTHRTDLPATEKKSRVRQVTKVTWRTRDCVSVARMHAATALTALIPYHSISVRDVEERKPCCVRLHTSCKSGPPRGSRSTVLSDRFLTNSCKKRVPSPPSHKADSGGLCFWQRKRRRRAEANLDQLQQALPCCRAHSRSQNAVARKGTVKSGDRDSPLSPVHHGKGPRWGTALGGEAKKNPESVKSQR
jgi:hypothetical protein